MGVGRVIGASIIGCIIAYVLDRYFLIYIQSFITGASPLLIMAVISFITGLVAGLIVATRIGGAIAGFITQLLPPLFLTIEAYIRGTGQLEQYLGEYGTWFLSIFTNPGPITTTPFIIALLGGLLGGSLFSGYVDVKEKRVSWQSLRGIPKTRNILHILKKEETVERICPNCGRKLLADSKFCNDCGYQLGSLSAVQQLAKKESKLEIECPNCGKKLLRDSKFCNSCGFKLGIAKESQETLFDDYIVLNGNEYDSQLLSVREKDQVVISAAVEGTEHINFYIMNDTTFSRWRNDEPVSDAYISKNYVSRDTTEWIPPRQGEYWVVFDNTQSQAKKRCKVQITLLRKINELD